MLPEPMPKITAARGPSPPAAGSPLSRTASRALSSANWLARSSKASSPLLNSRSGT